MKAFPPYIYVDFILRRNKCKVANILDRLKLDIEFSHAIYDPLWEIIGHPVKIRPSMNTYITYSAEVDRFRVYVGKGACRGFLASIPTNIL